MQQSSQQACITKQLHEEYRCQEGESSLKENGTLPAAAGGPAWDVCPVPVGDQLRSNLGGMRGIPTGRGSAGQGSTARGSQVQAEQGALRKGQQRCTAGVSAITLPNSACRTNPQNLQSCMPAVQRAHRRKCVYCSTPGIPNVLPWLPVVMASWSYSTKKRSPSSAQGDEQKSIKQAGRQASRRAVKYPKPNSPYVQRQRSQRHACMQAGSMQAWACWMCNQPKWAQPSPELHSTRRSSGCTARQEAA
jgi:hypothetical protein